MKKLPITLLALMLNAACITGASATPFDLAEWATNSDGVYIDSGVINENFSSKTFTLNFSGAGTHRAIVFVDPEIDQSVGPGFWYNEYGAINNSLAALQSWEIDEPGWSFGDIVDNGVGLGNNVQSGVLDNSNAVPVGSEDDVSMALGWDFTLLVDEFAEATFHLTDSLPTSFSGFYLTQTDPDSQATLYFYSTLNIQQCPTGGCGGSVPEPSMLGLLGIAMAGMLLARRKAA